MAKESKSSCNARAKKLGERMAAIHEELRRKHPRTPYREIVKMLGPVYKRKYSK